MTRVGILEIDSFFDSNFARLNASLEERGGGLIERCVGAYVARLGPIGRSGLPSCASVCVWSLYAVFFRRVDVGISSAEAARLICGEDAVLEAGQPLHRISSEIAPDSVDMGVIVPALVVTPA